MNGLEKIKEYYLLIIKYIDINLKKWFEYKIDAVLRSFAVFLREATSIIVIYFTFQKFTNINGWNINEMFFLFSFIFVTYSILILLFTGLRDFEYLIYTGEFDRFLLRPRGLLFQVIVWDADYFAAIGHGTLGIILFITTANSVGITWNVTNILFCISAIVGGVLIQGAIFLVLAALSIYFIKTGSAKDLFYYNARNLAQYPISIYPGLIQKFLIFIIPFAFVNYFPAQYFLQKPDMSNYWSGYMYLTFAVGFGLFFIAYIFWKHSIKRYSSTGS